MRRFAWLVCLLCTTTSSLASDDGQQRFSLRARAEPNPVVFGAPFELVLEVERDEGDRLSLPEEIPATAAAPLAGAPRRRLGPKAADARHPARVQEEIRIPFLALALDQVSTAALLLRAPDGETLEVEALQVDVVTTATGDAEDATPLREAPAVLTYTVFDDRPLWALAYILLVLGLWWMGRRFWPHVRAWLGRRAPPSASPTAPLLPAHTIALERLERLLSAGLLERGEVAPFVSRLMDDVLRDYLERRYGTRAGTRTTAELLSALFGVDVHGLDLEDTRRLLDDADLVKFARAEVATEVARGMAQRVRTLILATREADALLGGASS